MSEIDEERVPTAPEYEAFERLIAAAVDLANIKLSELRGTDFQGALATGRAAIHFTVELPKRRLKCIAVYPAFSREPQVLFEVMPAPPPATH